jgi:hypothetical protein
VPHQTKPQSIPPAVATLSILGLLAVSAFACNPSSESAEAFLSTGADDYSEDAFLTQAESLTIADDTGESGAASDGILLAEYLALEEAKIDEALFTDSSALATATVAAPRLRLANPAVVVGGFLFVGIVVVTLAGVTTYAVKGVIDNSNELISGFRSEAEARQWATNYVPKYQKNHANAFTDKESTLIKDVPWASAGLSALTDTCTTPPGDFCAKMNRRYHADDACGDTVASDASEGVVDALTKNFKIAMSCTKVGTLDARGKLSCTQVADMFMRSARCLRGRLLYLYLIQKGICRDPSSDPKARDRHVHPMQLAANLNGGCIAAMVKCAGFKTKASAEAARKANLDAFDDSLPTCQ